LSSTNPLDPVPHFKKNAVSGSALKVKPIADPQHKKKYQNQKTLTFNDSRSTLTESSRDSGWSSLAVRATSLGPPTILPIG
jgi:hypothetical protein